MPPRFLERINKQSETLKDVFGEAPTDPPPYAASTSVRSSVASSSALSMRSARSHISSQQAVASPPPRYNQVKQQRSSVDNFVVAIPRDSLVLVTGANSFQGMHIVAQLLKFGYRVRGTVRDAEKANWTTKYFGDQYGGGRYTAVVVPDMAVDGAFRDAVRECSGVVHVASVTFMSADPNQVVTPSIAGALNVLEAARTEPRITRFVYTSSVAACISHDRVERYEVSSHTWNMTDFNLAWAAPPYTEERALAVRSSAKMQTEAAVWRWCEVNKPKFTLNTVLPDILWGRILDPKNQSYPLSIEIVKAIHDGLAPEYPPSHFADVQDSALLHIAALILPDIQKQRIFAVSTTWTVDSLTQLMQQLNPHIPVDTDVKKADVGDRTFFREAGKAEELLKRVKQRGWTSVLTSVERTCASLR